MEQKENRLIDRNDELKTAILNRRKSLVGVVISGLITALIVAVKIDPSIADRISMDARIMKFYLPAAVVLMVINTILAVIYTGRIRKLSEELGERKDDSVPAEDPEEK